MINWKVRFTRSNMIFIIRFIGALLVPVLAYMGLQFEDLTTWGAVGDVLLTFILNPFLVVLTVFNALNIVPDPVTDGIGDSERGLGYKVPAPNARKTKGVK